MTATDVGQVFLEKIKARMVDKWRFGAFTHDLVDGPVSGHHGAVNACDMPEHNDRDKE